MKTTAEPIAFNEHLLRAINEAVRTTLKTVAGSDAVMLTHLIKSEVDSFGDISGVMTLVHPSSEGIIVISFPKETIFQILARVYKMNFNDLDGTVQDGVGELLNVIYGQFRRINTANAEGIRLTPPYVVMGDSHRILGANSGQTLVIPFRTENHIFHISFQIKAA